MRIGLEWNADGVRWCGVQRRENRWQIVEQFTQTWRSQNTASDLKDFVNERNFRGRSVALALPREQVFLSRRGVDAFPAQPEHLYTAVSDSLSAAVPRTTIERYRALFSDAGLRLNGVGFATTAQLTALTCLYPLPAHAEPLAILDLDRTRARLSLSANGNLHFCRSLICDESMIREIKKNIALAVRQCELSGPTSLLLLGSPPTEASNELSTHLGIEVIRCNEPLAAAGVALAHADPRQLWFCAPTVERGVIGRRWHDHKHTFMAAATLALTAAGMLLTRAIDDRRHVTAPMCPSSSVRTTDPTLSVLTETIARVPKNVHLFDYDYDAARSTLTMKARAADYGAVSAFVAALVEDQRFKNAHAEKANLIRVGDQSIIEFSVEATL